MRMPLVIAAALWFAVAPALAQEPQTLPPLALAHPDAAGGPPIVLTLQDALTRARQNDPQYQSAAAEADIAREDRVQARAGLFPGVSFSTQFLGNSPTPDNINPNGRFVSLDGVQMYRVWGIVHQELSANTFTLSPLKKAQAAELAAQARVEVAARGLVVTVTKAYYGLIAAERKYATSQQAVQQASRFLEITQQQERLGQVARSDSVKAEIQFRQQQQSFADATLAMNTARLMLAVLLFPNVTENFTIVDDLNTTAAPPPFGDVRTMAERNNPDLRAANEALRAASHDVQASRNAFYPSLMFEGVYGIEANELALNARVAAQPELGVLPTYGYFVTLNLQVPVWDWGNLRSKLHQSATREHQAQVTLNQTQRQLVGNLYSMYNEVVAARAALDNLQRAAELAGESLRLTNLRYQAGESTALEAVDAQNTLVQARNGFDDAAIRYRVALAELQTLTGNLQP